MSLSVNTVPQKITKPGLPWGLWFQQIRAIFNLEVGKTFLGKRSFLIYLLAVLPIFLLGLIVLVTKPANNFSRLAQIYSIIYSVLILRTVVFFGCAWIFMNLFRGELVDRSLHYYFLTPLRREVLIAGKYLSGLVTSVVLFGLTTTISLLLLYFPRFPAESSRYFLDGNGFAQLLTYLSITTLACIGYGAFFLVVGLFFRNPIIPALVLYGWEFINFLLPPVLKKISVIHYLNSLMPIPVSEGPFAVVVDPTPIWLAVPGLLIVTLLVLIVAGLRIRRLEIRYGD